MIKRCPECNRTYSDESISFCLADGALLSPPFEAIKEEPPPTEILPSARTPLPPTEPPKAAVPTMTSLGGQNYAPFAVDKPEPRRRSYGAFIWAALALLVVGGIVIGIFSVRRILNKRNAAVAASSPEPFLAQNTSSPPDSSQVPTTTTATATEANRSNLNANQTETKNTSSPQTEAKVTTSPSPPAAAQADPVLFPPDSRHSPEPKQPEAIDYNRVFSQREVDVKPQLLERPKPSYTDSARQNNVQGKVVLRVVLSANGSVGSISAISGLSHGLTEQAIAAARRIKFVPAQKDGRPVSVSVTVEYNFSVY